MQYRTRGTMDDGQEFTFTSDAPNFIGAMTAVSNTLALKLGPRAGQVASCKVSLMKALDGDFKLRGADKRSKAAKRTVPAIVAASIPAAPIPATASQPSKKR